MFNSAPTITTLNSSDIHYHDICHNNGHDLLSPSPSVIRYVHQSVNNRHLNILHVSSISSSVTGNLQILQTTGAAEKSNIGERKS